MNEMTRQALFEKNHRIIEAVMQRAQRVCPGALDMIAVTGSFASGDFHEKSDLDLLIVIGDERGYELSHCFILDDVGYDLYCHTWERLEGTASYDSPYVSKLLDAEIVYTKDESVLSRFRALSDRLQSHLCGPLTNEDYDRAEKQLAAAKVSYFDAMTVGESGYAFPLMGVMYALECAVYLLNHAVVRHGVRGICSELASMPSLPDDFLRFHTGLYSVHSHEEEMSCARNLIRNTERWMHSLRDSVYPRQTSCAENLCGSYEELYSNYRNKLTWASDRNDRYVSNMTLASAQLFFDEVASAVDLGETISFDTSSYSTPTTANDAFGAAMNIYERVYHKSGLQICRYADINTFMHEYINKK